MTAELPVHVNRGELHALEVPNSFEASGPFVLRVVNHGESSHVHVHLDDDLSSVASIGASNHYVEGGNEREIRVDVDENALSEEALRGTIKVAVAYGASTHWIDVELAEPRKGAGPVEIDETLSQPAPKSGGSTIADLVPPAETALLGFGVVALAVALIAALVLGNALVTILVGSLAVIGGVVIALSLYANR